MKIVVYYPAVYNYCHKVSGRVLRYNLKTAKKWWKCFRVDDG